MTNPERGGHAPQGESGKMLNPTERVRKAIDTAREVEDEWESEGNLGVAFALVGKLERLVQLVEEQPRSILADDVLELFEDIESRIEKYKQYEHTDPKAYEREKNIFDRWVKGEVEDRIDDLLGNEIKDEEEE